MAIQIWDAQAGQYKSADLARFGGSGTLTEALVWDGTQYVKVWSASIYPVSGTWESALTGSAVTYADHTIAEDGSYTLTHTVTGGGQYVGAAIVGPWGTTNGTPGPPSTATTTQTLAAGDLIEFQGAAYLPSGNYSGSFSIVKN